MWSHHSDWPSCQLLLDNRRTLSCTKYHSSHPIIDTHQTNDRAPYYLPHAPRVPISTARLTLPILSSFILNYIASSNYAELLLRGAYNRLVTRWGPWLPPIYELSQDVAITHDSSPHHRTVDLRGPAAGGAGLGVRVRQSNKMCLRRLL